jgi:YggT family protein
VHALGDLIKIVAYVLIATIFIRSILSWTGFDPRNAIYRALIDVTEPILAPIRSILPRMTIDLSPMVAIFLLIFLAQIGSRIASGG